MSISTPVNEKKILAGDYKLPNPNDIDTSQHFWNAFGRAEVESSAHYIVLFFQKCNKDWSYGFTQNEINIVYEECGHHNGYWDNGLFENYCVEKDGKYYVTEEFVRRCAGEIKT